MEVVELVINLRIIDFSGEVIILFKLKTVLVKAQKDKSDVVLYR